MLNPKRGDIAVCSLGLVGLITSDGPEWVEYNDGQQGVAWTGIQLRDATFEGVGGDKGKQISVRAGDPWCSRAPKVVESITGALEAFWNNEKDIPQTLWAVRRRFNENIGHEADVLAEHESLIFDGMTLAGSHLTTTFFNHKPTPEILEALNAVLARIGFTEYDYLNNVGHQWRYTGRVEDERGLETSDRA